MFAKVGTFISKMGARPSLAMKTFIDVGTKVKTRLIMRLTRGRVFGIYVFVCDQDMALCRQAFLPDLLKIIEK